MHGGLLEILAREKAGMPETWRVFRWECFPKQEATIYYELTGAVVPMKTRGPEKGEPNWRKLDKATRRVIVLTVDGAAMMAAEWSKRTGLCIECIGEGKTFTSWSLKDGVTHKPCGECSGTGKAKEAP
jgi:hypothetical protein